MTIVVEVGTVGWARTQAESRRGQARLSLSIWYE